jgi:hypothetical protein
MPPLPPPPIAVSPALPPEGVVPPPPPVVETPPVPAGEPPVPTVPPEPPVPTMPPVVLEPPGFPEPPLLGVGPSEFPQPLPTSEVVRATAPSVPIARLVALKRFIAKSSELCHGIPASTYLDRDSGTGFYQLLCTGILRGHRASGR